MDPVPPRPSRKTLPEPSLGLCKGGFCASRALASLSACAGVRGCSLSTACGTTAGLEPTQHGADWGGMPGAALSPCAPSATRSALRQRPRQSTDVLFYVDRFCTPVLTP